MFPQYIVEIIGGGRSTRSIEEVVEVGVEGKGSIHSSGLGRGGAGSGTGTSSDGGSVGASGTASARGSGSSTI